MLYTEEFLIHLQYPLLALQQIRFLQKNPRFKKGKTILKKVEKKTLNGPSDYELDLTQLPKELRGKQDIDIAVTGELPSGERVVSKVPLG